MANSCYLALTSLFLLQGQCDDTSNQNCAYFIYESTPYPLNLCMTSERSQSVMYRCANNVISFNRWNSADCTGNINETNYYNASSSFVHNCDGSLLSNAANCELATLDIWNSAYCASTPDYALFLVLNVCIPVNHTHSIYYGCNEHGVITQDVYLNTVECTGVAVSNSYDSLDTAESSICFRMSCDGNTYISNNQSAPNTVRGASGTGSFWSDPRAEEVVFIIAAGSVLCLFWSCYFYRKCCRVSKEQIEQEMQEEHEVEKGKNAAYDVLRDDHGVEQGAGDGGCVHDEDEVHDHEDNAGMVTAAMAVVAQSHGKMDQKNVKLLDIENEDVL